MSSSDLYWQEANCNSRIFTKVKNRFSMEDTRGRGEGKGGLLVVDYYCSSSTGSKEQTSALSLVYRRFKRFKKDNVHEVTWTINRMMDTFGCQVDLRKYVCTTRFFSLVNIKTNYDGYNKMITWVSHVGAEKTCILAFVIWRVLPEHCTSPILPRLFDHLMTGWTIRILFLSGYCSTSYHTTK